MVLTVLSRNSAIPVNMVTFATFEAVVHALS